MDSMNISCKHMRYSCDVMDFMNFMTAVITYSVHHRHTPQDRMEHWRDMDATSIEQTKALRLQRDEGHEAARADTSMRADCVELGLRVISPHAGRGGREELGRQHAGHQWRMQLRQRGDESGGRGSRGSRVLLCANGRRALIRVVVPSSEHRLLPLRGGRRMLSLGRSPRRRRRHGHEVEMAVSVEEQQLASGAHHERGGGRRRRGERCIQLRRRGCSGVQGR
jgi:hypothetical protein